MNLPNPPIQEAINGALSVPWKAYFSSITNYLRGLPASNDLLPEYANDAAALAGGLPLYAYYRTGSLVKQRVS